MRQDFPQSLVPHPVPFVTMMVTSVVCVFSTIGGSGIPFTDGKNVVIADDLNNGNLNVTLTLTTDSVKVKCDTTRVTKFLMCVIRS